MIYCVPYLFYFSFQELSNRSQTHNINGEKTKVITTMEEVWKCDLNCQNFGLRNYIKHSKECFIRFPNTYKLVKNLSCAFFFFFLFNPLLGVWKSDETLFLMFDILLKIISSISQVNF